MFRAVAELVFSAAAGWFHSPQETEPGCRPFYDLPAATPSRLTLAGAISQNRFVKREHPGNPILITGATGQVGRELCAQLRACGANLLATDLDPGVEPGIVACDLTAQDQISQLFRSQPVAVIIHLAGILPSAFLADPLRGIEVNVTASCRLLREAVEQGVKRFVFASSMSVYGSTPRAQPVREEDPLAPDDPYAACKCAVEAAGEALRKKGDIEFVALRIARVVGRGARNTSSPWRSQIFEPARAGEPIPIPFAPETRLSLVHVREVARMLAALLEPVKLQHAVYNAPAETWEAKRLQAMVEKMTGARLLLGGNASAGPACDGSRFAREFAFRLRGLTEYLAVHAA